MQTNLLRKCVDELSKEKPDISYLKGVLETLIEVSGTPVATVKNIGNTYGYPVNESLIKTDEEIIPDFLKAGPVGTMNNG